MFGEVYVNMHNVCIPYPSVCAPTIGGLSLLLAPSDIWLAEPKCALELVDWEGVVASWAWSWRDISELRRVGVVSPDIFGDCGIFGGSGGIM